jgi:hypothetical protein
MEVIVQMGMSVIECTLASYGWTLPDRGTYWGALVVPVVEIVNGSQKSYE